MGRAKDWNKSLAEEMQNPDFARAFIRDSLAEGLPLMVVLRKTIAAYGLKEFAEKLDMAPPNLLQALTGNLKLKTLNRILGELGLSLGVVELKR